MIRRTRGSCSSLEVAVDKIKTVGQLQMLAVQHHPDPGPVAPRQCQGVGEVLTETVPVLVEKHLQMVRPVEQEAIRTAGSEVEEDVGTEAPEVAVEDILEETPV
jgi:hypothetical protein